MEVRYVVALSVYQELVSHLTRLLYRRNIRPKALKVGDVIAPCLSNPRTMEIVERLGWTAANWSGPDQYRLFLDVKMNLRFRQQDYFVTQDGVVLIAVPKKSTEEVEQKHATET